MEEATISDSLSSPNRRITELSSADNGSDVDGDQSSCEEASIPFSLSEKPVLVALGVRASKEKGESAEIVSGALSPGERSHVCFQREENWWPCKPVVHSESVCAVLGEDIQENEEGDTLCGAINGKPKEQSSGSDVHEMREIQKGGESEGVANGKSKQEATGFKVLVADSGKPSEKIDAVREEFGRSLEIELIDDTDATGLSNIGMERETAGRKNVKKESEAKKEKNPRRRSKAAKKGSDENKYSSNMKVSAGNSTGFKRTEKETKIVYSMKEMETLRYCNVKGQRTLWQEIYTAFSPTVRTEYDELSSVRHQNKQSGLSWNTYCVPGVLGEVCKETVDADLEIPILVECTCDDNYNGEDDKFLCEEYVEVEDSDDVSIQRRAFLVEGEPDFDSGPPEDGLEYLRRVRSEAAQIPNVRVAKLDKSKMKEQSVYMPEIPEIERCPEHVLPSKEWEKEFLSDFSELRLAISRLDGCHGVIVNQTVGGSKGPTLSRILKMDVVGRVSMLKREIGLFEDEVVSRKERCLWVFGLCAATDTPLDADTSAALRGLLRKCSKLRATKSHLDDQAIMLNMLVTISGKYFGQTEN